MVVGLRRAFGMAEEDTMTTEHDVATEDLPPPAVEELEEEWAALSCWP